MRKSVVFAMKFFVSIRVFRCKKLSSSFTDALRTPLCFLGRTLKMCFPPKKSADKTRILHQQEIGG